VVFSYNTTFEVFLQEQKNAKLMTWHKSNRKQDHMLRHPADGSQWRKIDRKYKYFVGEARNIRFGLSIDGFNPFGEFSSGHITWPVTLCMFNLPGWMCMKRKFIMMPLLIQGRKQPGNDIVGELSPELVPLVDRVLVERLEPGEWCLVQEEREVKAPRVIVATSVFNG
jgi:hypothetical protein